MFSYKSLPKDNFSKNNLLTSRINPREHHLVFFRPARNNKKVTKLPKKEVKKNLSGLN